MSSFEELWNSSSATTGFFIGLILLFIIIAVVGYNSAKKQNTSSKYNEDFIEPISNKNLSNELKEERARVISKNAGLVNWITFEMANSTKMTFEVQDKDMFESVFSGDFVIIKYRGSKLIGFGKE